jgi:hypothetical protein
MFMTIYGAYRWPVRPLVAESVSTPHCATACSSYSRHAACAAMAQATCKPHAPLLYQRCEQGVCVCGGGVSCMCGMHTGQGQGAVVIHQDTHPAMHATNHSHAHQLSESGGCCSGNAITCLWPATSTKGLQKWPATSTKGLLVFNLK